ncbi:MAG: formate-dependent phosphoribosylglycinamide formyltransferase, partial [Plesiomonas sp.]
PELHSTDLRFRGLAQALAAPNVQLRLFGKPEIAGRRRLGVTLSRADNTERAVEIATQAAQHILVSG